MEMKDSDRSRLVQRQRYPLPSRSLQYWPMSHRVLNTTPRRSVFEKLSNSKIIFLTIVSVKSVMENSIIQELNAEADRIILLFFFFSCHLFPYLHKSCLISWQILFTKHFKFVSWSVAPPDLEIEHMLWVASSGNRWNYRFGNLPYRESLHPSHHSRVFHIALRRCETLWSAREIASMALSAKQARHTENVFHIALRVGSIPTLHLKNFEQLFWATTWRKNSRKAQWQAQSRYLCHCAFLVSFRYAGSEKTWLNHFICISLTLVTPPAVLRR